MYCIVFAFVWTKTLLHGLKELQAMFCLKTTSAMQHLLSHGFFGKYSNTMKLKLFTVALSLCQFTEARLGEVINHDC